MATPTTMATAITTITMTTATATEAGDGALHRLLAWTSPAYPTGAFSYSHGLEWAVEDGLVRDRATLEAWIGHVLAHGAGWTDAVLLARTHDAVCAGDWDRVAEIAELAAALRATAELALENAQQGSAFLAVTRAAWPDPALDRLATLRAGQVAPLAVVQGVATAGHVPLPAALVAMSTAFAAALVSAGVRLVPLGQTDGQRATAALAPVVSAVAARAATASLDELGAASPMVDWASMRHETQYTRLFRS
ncbi:MAG: urease accessory protein UreF [Alphaproteobacteria bacterium]